MARTTSSTVEGAQTGASPLPVYFSHSYRFEDRALNEFFWRSFTTETWIASKMFVSFPATMIFAFFQIPLLKRHWQGDDNPFA